MGAQVSKRRPKYGVVSAHKRWHVNRNQTNPRCPLCNPDAVPYARPRRRRRQLTERKVVLSLTDIDALRQLVERVDHLMRFVRILVHE